jgi:hypothetical protein
MPQAVLAPHHWHRQAHRLPSGTAARSRASLPSALSISAHTGRLEGGWFLVTARLARGS